MKLNDFSLCPVVKASKGKQKFLQCIDQNGEAHFIEGKIAYHQKHRLCSEYYTPYLVLNLLFQLLEKMVNSTAF